MVAGWPRRAPQLAPRAGAFGRAPASPDDLQEVLLLVDEEEGSLSWGRRGALDGEELLEVRDHPAYSASGCSSSATSARQRSCDVCALRSCTTSSRTMCKMSASGSSPWTRLPGSHPWRAALVRIVERYFEFAVRPELAQLGRLLEHAEDLCRAGQLAASGLGRVMDDRARPHELR